MQSTIENRTIFCHDNLQVLQGINTESIDLIYLDPPFNTKKIFTAPIGSSAQGAEFSDIFRKEDVKEEWLQTIKEDQEKLHTLLESVKVIEGKNSYNFCYLAYMAIRLIEMYRVLKTTGSIYLHCDPTMSHYLKLVLDIIFGEKNFRNEIIWSYQRWTGATKFFQRMHDIIFFYSKNAKNIFNQITEPYSAKSKHKGKRFSTTDEGGKVIRQEYVSKTREKSMRDVWDISILNSQAKERTGYPTQKPVALLDRIIRASSNKGDFVLDPFCGCATTCIAAEKLGRQWIGIDVSYMAYELVKDRLNEEIANPEELFAEKVFDTTVPPVRTDLGEDPRPKKWVYVISNPQFVLGMYKVGITADLEKRLDSYQTGDPDRGYIVEHKKLTPHFREIERYIHEKFENKHEWVRARLFDIVEAIEGYSPEYEHERSDGQSNLLVAED